MTTIGIIGSGHVGSNLARAAIVGEPGPAIDRVEVAAVAW
jgi:hypothetical protein